MNLEQIISLKNKEISQLKNIMYEKDKSLTEFIENNLRAPSETVKAKYEVVNECKHEGLIRQFEKNIKLK